MATRAEDKAAQDIISIGRTAYAKNLVAARAGNLSIRLGADRFMITGQGAALGFLCRRDLIITDLDGRKKQGSGGPSFETGLHSALYKNLDARAVVHLHPPFTLALIDAQRVLKPVTFEAALFLGTVPVIPQQAPNVIDTMPVVAALSLNNIVILKNHGVVSVGETLRDAFFLAELLEESARMNIFTSLLRKDEKKSAGRAPAAGKKEKPVALFSKAHWLRLEAVLNREHLQQPGLISLVIKQSDTGMAYTLVFEDGKLSLRAGAEKSSLLLSGTGTVWRSVFKGLMDPFTAVIQHKMSLEGSMQEFLQLYPLLRTVFKVWQTIPVST